MSGNLIVVGLDGSPASLTALRWALAEAAARRGAVHLLYAQPPPPWLRHTMHAEAHEVLSGLVEQARRLAPAVPTTGAVVPGAPVRALLHAAEAAQLLVLGADHGHHRVSAQVAMLAPCPVAVLPAGHHPGASPGPVVAGVDGSESAALALRYALATAERWHTRAVAVHAWQPVTLGVHRLRQLPDSFDHLAETHGRILSRAVQRWQPAFPGTPVAEKLAIGAAHRVLLDEAARARLLVLGSHGWGSLHQATLGSVGVQILRDPPCPVVVVHPHRHAAEPVPAMQAAGDRR